VVVEKVWVVAIRPFKDEMPEPPVELTTSNEKPKGAVEEAVKTLPSAPETVVKALVPEASKTPRVNEPAPLPPDETPKALERESEVPVAAVKLRETMVLEPLAIKLETVEVPLTTKDLVEEDQVKLASPANTPPLLYWIWVVAPPGFVEPPVPQAAQAIPPFWVELAVRQLLSVPTPFTIQVVPEATIRLPVVVARLFMSLILPGKLKVTPLILNPPL